MPRGYRPWHFQHHKHLGTDADPELSYRSLEPYIEPPSWKRVVFYFFGDITGAGVLDLYRFMKAVFPYGKPTVILFPIAFWILFCGVTLYFHCFWVFALWLWSIIGGFWPVFRIRTWAEHVGLADMELETTHRISVPRLLRFLVFPHNTHCHYEHHKWSQVPYYNLPALRQLDEKREVLSLFSIFPWDNDVLESTPGFRLIGDEGKGE